MDWFIYEFLIVLFLTWALLFPILLYIPLFRWWRENDPKNEYNCLSISLMAYYKYNNIIYRLFNFASQNAVQFKYDFWVIFIASIISGEAAGVVPQGICTPKTLCKSLIPTDTPIGPLPTGGRVWPTATGDWQKLLAAWSGQTTVPSDPSNWNPVPGAWAKDPTNFLAAWGITEFSPAVIGFVTNTSDENKGIYPDSILPLLGLSNAQGDIAGGWLGYLQYGDDFNGGGMSEADRRIWSNVIPPNISNGRKQQCQAAGIVSQGIGLGMGGAFAGAALGSVVPGVGNVIGAIIGFFVGAAAGAALGGWSGGCFN